MKYKSKNNDNRKKNFLELKKQNKINKKKILYLEIKVINQEIPIYKLLIKLQDLNKKRKK